MLILIIMSWRITVWWVVMNITLDVKLRISTSFTCFQFGWNSSDYSTTSTTGKCQNWIRNLPQIRCREEKNFPSFFLPWIFHQPFFWKSFVFLDPVQWVDIFSSHSFKLHKYPFKFCQMSFVLVIYDFEYRCSSICVVGWPILCVNKQSGRSLVSNLIIFRYIFIL